MQSIYIQNMVGDECPPRRGLLESLGLSKEKVVNIIMHKDIVPRAFACNFALVAEWMKTWSESYREHKCLNTKSTRKLMWNFIGMPYIRIRFFFVKACTYE